MNEKVKTKLQAKMAVSSGGEEKMRRLVHKFECSDPDTIS